MTPRMTGERDERTMRKRIAVLLAAAASILLVYAILFTSLEVCISGSIFRSFANREYTALVQETSKKVGTNTADTVNSCIRLVDYMRGKADSIDIEVSVNGERVLMFDQEQEKEHMADVRLLYGTCASYREKAITAAVVLYFVAALLTFRSSAKTIAKGYIWGSLTMLAALGFVGTWAALDFSNFWTQFHKIFFWNDKWLFDESTSRMINILPEQFFSDLILIIAGAAGAVIVLLLILSVIVVIRSNKKEEKAYEKAVAEAKRRRRLAAKRRMQMAAAAENAAAGTDSGEKKQRRRLTESEIVESGRRKRKKADGRMQNEKKASEAAREVRPETEKEEAPGDENV